MNPTWKDHLIKAGATLVNDHAIDFGNPGKELLATQSGAILTDLSHRGMVGINGEDSQTFLQGQTTNDVRLATDRAQYNSLCTPKGRMLASFLLWREDDGYFLQLPAALQAGIQKRLTMYVLRSKVKVRDVGDESVRLGVAGMGAEALLQAAIGALPPDVMGVVCHDKGTIIRLGATRFEIVVLPEQGPTLWEELRRQSTPVGSACWEWLEIHAGIPTILPQTQEQFTPQMANFEAIGGVSFTKGCYTGQEIVARTQYLGKVKRRLHLAHLDADSAPQPGDELFGAEPTAGMVVNAQPAPAGGYDLLAVIPTGSVEAGAVHFKTPDGPALHFLPLPYPV
ncbi:MAG: glycine cleavage system protein T [Betaproteobacteria bacterium CG2_30_59_46]|nr:MAG: glycine cleavage system protein T [Betaproteobacteria bacterium CG2_30_59_46]PIQ13185.1 MAG: glycine cleavage system protein T [Hydrogenophilales bacterium CG18_big_fil_WC_8_21_14_2_50_58_12]PIY00922.1 MAG: folate-binding protein [Hydrogenophilales bacterium CG_4_10_14_3_um_filter_58_23]PJB06216.1 MAG: folate-binding protein [Hydrogenophilales bacterium CG_4_9_14_3_um_filter_59_35]